VVEGARVGVRHDEAREKRVAHRNSSPRDGAKIAQHFSAGDAMAIVIEAPEGRLKLTFNRPAGAQFCAPQLTQH
jgi:hypothetical protein